MRFNPDNPILHALSNIFDIVVTTFFFMICCLPVFTVGAAITAMQTTMMSIDVGGCTGVCATYWGAFRKNFKLSTLLWLPLMVIGAVVVVEVWGCWLTEQNSTMLLAMMRGMCLFSAVIYSGFVSYLFPGIGMYEVTWKQALRNSLYMMFKKPGYTLGLITLLGLMIALGFVFLPLLFVVIAVGTYCQAKLLNRAFGFSKGPENHEEEIWYE